MPNNTASTKQQISHMQLSIICNLNRITRDTNIVVSDADYTNIINWVFEVLNTKHLPTIYKLFPIPLHIHLLNESFQLITINNLANHEKIISDIQIKFAKTIELVKLLLLTKFLDNE